MHLIKLTREEEEEEEEERRRREEPRGGRNSYGLVGLACLSIASAEKKNEAEQRKSNDQSGKTRYAKQFPITNRKPTRKIFSCFKRLSHPQKHT